MWLLKGLKMVDKCVSVFKELSTIPVATGAFCRHFKPEGVDKIGYEVISRWEVRDLVRVEKTSFQKSHVLIDGNTTSTSPVELNQEKLRAYSSDGRVAILRSISNKQGTDKCYLEIWNGSSKLKTLDLLAQEKHLQVNVDCQFGCLRWSSCGTRLLYVAEKYFKAESFFKSSKTVANEEPKKDEGEEFLYRESWGETLGQAHHPCLFTLNVETDEICEVQGIGDHISCGQAVWTPDSKGVVFVGWDHSPFRLGLIYCNNRRSSIYHAHLESKECSVIGSGDESVEEPRFSPDGKYLVYFQSKCFGPHRNVQSLMKCDWSTKTVTTIVDEVRSSDLNQFPGLNVIGVPERIWLDNKSLIVHSIWRSKQELVEIDVETGAVTRLTNDRQIGNWTLLDVFDNVVVAVPSAPDHRPTLALGRFSFEESSEDRIKWVWLERVDKISDHLKWETINLNPPPDHVNPKYENLDYDALLMKPMDVKAKPYPLIVFPHGGPHSTICAAYYLSIEYFCRLGFAVLCVNYRGSLGFGQDNIESLLGNIGKQDVLDMKFAVESALNDDDLDRNRMVLYGGSHGGFLALSLAGQYPDTYKACVVRNPVADVAGMIGSTDIPDWNFSESGLTYGYKSLTDPFISKLMWECSPIRLIDQIRIPVLFTLGKNDLRVPCQQGLQAYKALKARNIETRVYMYDDCHGLQKVDSESNGMIVCAKWMLKYIE